jgi:methylated-DNA-[protein]-cysteine S-methyltransferase
MTGTTYEMQIKTSVGTLVLAADDEGLTQVVLPGGVRRRRPDEPPAGAPAHLGDAAVQLAEYFGGARSTFDLPLVAEGTEFQRQVWFALADIPYGETISYAELARWVGRPNAFRAVGQANGANPLPIVLPCHRVVASGGGIGGYGGGLDMKRELLALESTATR